MSVANHFERAGRNSTETTDILEWQYPGELPHRSQHLVDEALAAALIADAPGRDFEFVIVAGQQATGRHTMQETATAVRKKLDG